jgi:hypothetical protein
MEVIAPKVGTYTDDNRQVTIRTSRDIMVFFCLVSEGKENNNSNPTGTVAGPT